MSRLVRHARRVCAGLAATCAGASVFAQEGAGKLKGFGLAEGGDVTPGIGRVLLAFALVAALAWVMAWALRRYGPRFGIGTAAVAGAGNGAPVRAVSRTSLPGGVVCHVVEAEGRRVLVTVTRQGVSTLLLSDAPATAAAEEVP